jgi:hypothetical protein
MLALLTRRRRPPARRPSARRPELEHLEGRNAPSSLDATSSLTSFDLSSSQDEQVSQLPAAPGPTDTSSATGGGVSGGATTTAPGLLPAAGSGTFIAAVIAPAVPPRTAALPAAASGTDTPPGTPGMAGPGMPQPLVINPKINFSENDNATVTVWGSVTDPDPTATVTVTLAGDVIPDGTQTAAQADGCFKVTFKVSYASGITQYNCVAKATDTAGLEAKQTFIVSLTAS